MYINGIKKFKNSCKLRISYAFFLLERISNKKKALDELVVAENLKPEFDEQFLIYRYKKMIEDS
jgi:PAS domain S-box-containing protein